MVLDNTELLEDPVEYYRRKYPHYLTALEKNPMACGRSIRVSDEDCAVVGAQLDKFFEWQHRLEGR